ncbi:hypothetical protein [Krasilnikoviella flava]|uniref:Alpha/beta hydrolase n=1 Tax=Krasilnikoviella flava TaxID=526729 RepID=A0A1T5LZ65_9MICO|nr:hypothetical protein [Krasilnikoviella flava]SKC81114.1 hypothetical protein SAMN04324258_4163 [Krasilnikoviella flava]
MTRLVLVHGRDLDGRDPEALEAEWLGALGAGLAAAGSTLRPTDADASFVYYGDTLERLVDGGTPPPVTVHARGADPAALPRLAGALPDGEVQFVLDVARDVLAATGHRPDVGPVPPPVEAEGVVGDALVEALVAALALVDRYVPGVSAAVLLTLTRDVYAVLHDDAVRRVVEAGLDDALAGDEPAVVVAHSLGSVVAYPVLAGRNAGPDVPLLLTPGSPLGIRAVLAALHARAPLRFPAQVARWVSPRDPRDLLALHDLTPAAFPLPTGSPGVEALRVTNRAPGSHAAAYRLDGGWAGYLALPEVAGPVAEALT